MRRKDREKDELFALEVIKNAPYATLSMVRPDGKAYGVPISPAVADGAVYFHCADEGLKLDCIKSNSCVCLTAVSFALPTPEDYSMDYSSAIVTGSAAIVTDREEKILALREICLRYAPENMAMFDGYIDRYLDKTCIVKITADEITGKARKTK